MNYNLSVGEIKNLITSKLSHNFGIRPDEALSEHFYQASAMIVRDLLTGGRKEFIDESEKQNKKRIYYLCMEFLMGRSLRNNLYNLGLTEKFAKALDSLGAKLDNVYEKEPDAGLGNGGLGRLAACFLDSLATEGFPAMGYSLRYEFGIFTQKIVEGWQTELPEFWLPGGEVWLTPRPDEAMEVKFGGRIEESWENGFHHLRHVDYTSVRAVPYDMCVAGKGGKGVSILRLWDSESNSFDIGAFNDGEHLRAVEEIAMAESLTKVLYPGDNHPEGKSLRLSQQYFLVSASIQDIIKRHFRWNSSLENLSEALAIHINDTHPALAIPELMRILMDECGYSWDAAWKLTTGSTAYTNHTVMAEALECWRDELFKRRLPRIYQIVCEINHRFCEEMTVRTNYDYPKVERMSIMSNGFVKMANLCVASCHSVNGVSQLHSDIIKDDVFHDFYTMMPNKFKNVTNGIAHRRWLCQANPKLTEFLSEKIGSGFITDASELEKLLKFADDKKVLNKINEIKLYNKKKFADYILKNNGIVVDPESIFDVQVKRLHEYKRQHLNAMHILSEYLWLKENPNAEFVPKTYIFGAKAASGYFMAKQIIRFIVKLGEQINNDPAINGKLKIVYLENYRVSVAELLMPAADISEQISLSGTEASGTGNMKLMINGALTLGTEDGANVEIHRAVGDDNIFIFGMSTPEVNDLKQHYNPIVYYNNNITVRRVLDEMRKGFGGIAFDDIANNLMTADPYMVLADFENYAMVQSAVNFAFRDKEAWARRSLVNIAKAGIFSSDRAIQDYARDIWSATPLALKNK
ncbi:MAG: glycogen/starch/alpha-glucan phosphorylase [Oscillospiraceae bacterium]|nr:glycogen/starch/alpha-glucan phosphorylase [Oscillospiraceae bacterium]